MSVTEGAGGVRAQARDRWLRCREPRPDAATVLVCFPHAGGSASAYLPWTSLLPPEIELRVVQYPGREDRFALAPADSMGALLDGVLPELAELPGRLALFGHSMGGAVAHEAALHLHRQGRKIDHLIVSGRQPPQHHRGGALHAGTDDELTAELARLDPGNTEVLDQRELMALVLPAIRADYRLIETYRPARAGPLDCPTTVLIGDDDTELTASEAHDWAGWTSESTQVHTFPGGHFFVVSERAAVVERLAQALQGGERR